MAEFTEVMRQARRMCAAHGNGVDDCEKCPVYDKWGIKFGCRVVDPSNKCPDETYTEFERTVMQWAAEHPEPHPMTWAELWKHLFPNSSSMPCVSQLDPTICCTGRCDRCRNSPVPADIAEKLGIKPIGGDANEG